VEFHRQQEGSLADYRVSLDIFAGPLDLLLYLVRKEEVDIYDIPLAKITDQYLHYVELLKQLDIDVAGDFLVMAATLMEIKSAMLLPKAEPEEMGEDEAGDPRTELIRQLLEYKKFKDAANLLNAAAEQQKERFARPANLIDRLAPDAEPEVDMDQVSVWDLLEAFDAVCRATGANVYTGHIQDDTPIDLYQIELLHRLQTEGPLTFERVFDSRPNRLVMVGLFLALLELVRDKLVWAEQSETSPEIYLRALTDEPAEQAVQRAILSVEEDQAGLSTDRPQRPQAPPIPIAELPPRPESPSGDKQSEETRGAAEPPPIPIAELPPKRRSPSDEHEDEEIGETAAADDDLMFDKP
jgi:segregation and condensation protein A